MTNNIDQYLPELYSHISNPSRAQNINKEAFHDISRVLLSFHFNHSNEYDKLVAIASMGHGKTTSLISYLKWITTQNYKQPLLVAVKEKQLAHEIYNQVHSFSPSSIINIDAENKNLHEDDLYKYQIVIIQHQRLKNLALGFGNIFNYQYFYTKKKADWGESKGNERVKRLFIIDEKPDFHDSVIFDITNQNNVLEWFDDLAEPMKILPRKLQKYKSYIVFLLSEQLADNSTDITTKLFKDDDLKGERSKDLLELLDSMKEHEGNKNKYESLNKMKHFRKLLKKDDYGRIDDYEFGTIGRKIIISKIITYDKFKTRILIFDGTAQATSFQYAKAGFKGKILTNRNDYTRLDIQVDNINTTKYSRSKADHSTQKAIAKRIKEIQQHDKELFVLPMKDEINIYMSEGVIPDKDKLYYYDNETQHTKGINLLNTVGKNVLHNKTSLYMTCLPKKNADYYKQIAIAVYGNELSLLTSTETDKGNWFQDEKLEGIYRGELYSEILQIIHRTALRKINSKEKITIYMAYDEESLDKYAHLSKYTIKPISENLKHLFLNKECNILPQHDIVNMSLYGRDKKIEAFAIKAKEMIVKSNKEVINANLISNVFKKFLHNHWDSKQDVIKREFRIHGLIIYVDEQDKRKPKKVKLI